MDTRVRPATNKIVKALFDIIRNYELNGNLFLDLFSGTGRICFEAEKENFEVIGTEINKKQYNLILKKIKEKNSKIKIVNMDAIKFLEYNDKKFDIIYIDPPYKRIDLYLKSLEEIKKKKLLNKEGLLIIEKSKYEKFEKKLNCKIYKKYSYGDTELLLIKEI
ncbi:MAG TPA: 23S rRNA (adenine(2030)-N(6))-methyltransferase RlmJ [bacterium]|nr:23S rRNA (adenine(2030)-N(6))-methyltransferase RlmJ [bacterium]HOL47686.1 23S rRNA (adenine(2030)-N(6))-methyltransferase RlmJ [bacterium]HPQ18710.1 23S rRNA (adenine(2030)-N(6))-methyltransferase RlmJ [bacterium]